MWCRFYINGICALTGTQGQLHISSGHFTSMGYAL